MKIKHILHNAIGFVVFLASLSIIIGMIYFITHYPKQPELYPLVQHTITKGNVAKVVYLERWTDETSWASCTDFIIVWPAGASKGYIDAMLEQKQGEMVHEYIQIGWWRKSDKFLPTVIP